MKTLLISPHFDDAVLSAGQYMAGNKLKCDVLTVFSEIPQVDAKYVTPYDKSCGFKTSKDAMVVRRQEDEEALAILGAGSKHLGLLDSQYEGGSTIDDLMNALGEFLLQHGNEYDKVLAPLGLRHPDHIIVSDVARWAIGESHELYVWEDLPHRVQYPEEVHKRLEYITPYDGASPVLAFIGDGPIADKVRALWCYRSQMAKGDLNPYLLYVPERFWKV